MMKCAYTTFDPHLLLRKTQHTRWRKKETENGGVMSKGPAPRDRAVRTCRATGKTEAGDPCLQAAREQGTRHIPGSRAGICGHH